MTAWWQLVVLFFAAVNPGAVAAAFVPRPTAGERPRIAIAALAIAAIAFIPAALSAEPLLDALEIEPETFRIAAGVVLLVTGAQAVIFGHPRLVETRGWQRGIYPLGIPLLAGPATLIAVVNFAADADAGAAKTLGAVVPAILVALAFALAVPAGPRGVLEGIGRLTGAVAIALAAALVVSGVRDV